MIHQDGAHFKDEHGRTRILRGINLGGTSKLPVRPDGATHLREGFFQHRDVSFVGRPFPLEEADEHFERLQAWGFTFLRFLVTWEAIEHAGPGMYDEAYLDYIEAIVDRAADYDMQLFIDTHQDVWSRFSGGDGAPGWTLDMLGFEMRNFQKTGAALVHQLHGDPFPRMQWAGNYVKLAAGTMFTLFFAGNHFAPQTTIDGEPVQEFLQRHYINAVAQVAQRVADKPHVIGFDIFNEPSKGYIGWHHANRLEGTNRIGSTPTPYQAMLLSSGYKQRVAKLELSLMGIRPGQRVTIDPDGVRAWQDDTDCIWRKHGVWDTDSAGRPQLLKPHYFAEVNGKPVNFSQDYLRPFVNRFAETIHAIQPKSMIFLEFDAFEYRDVLPYWTDDDAPGIVYAPHWYEGFTLMTKRYWRFIGFEVVPGIRPLFGHARVRRSYVEQLAHHKKLAQLFLGDVPTLIGEIGIPYDLRNSNAYENGDFSRQEDAIDDYMQALEANLLSATIWNYTPDNSNARGDLWNGEDLSIFSPDQRDNPQSIHSGGRALKTLLRPYACAVCGEPLKMRYDAETGVFEFTFLYDSSINQPTEFYVPAYQYPEGYIVEVLDGTYERDDAHQRLYYYPAEQDVPKWLRIKPTVPRPTAPDKRGWLPVAALIAGLLGLLWWWRSGRE